MQDLKLRFSVNKDISKVKEILTSLKLPTEEVESHFDNFIIAEYLGKFAGCAGLEIYGDIALGRSFAVRKDLQNKGIGKELLEKMLAFTKEKKIVAIYILTTTADKYLSKFGFADISRDLVPIQVRASSEFSNICPVSAKCMKKSIPF